jgi:hypothetical protein
VKKVLTGFFSIVKFLKIKKEVERSEKVAGSFCVSFGGAAIRRDDHQSTDPLTNGDAYNGRGCEHRRYGRRGRSAL